MAAAVEGGARTLPPALGASKETGVARLARPLESLQSASAPHPGHVRCSTQASRPETPSSRNTAPQGSRQCHGAGGRQTRMQQMQRGLRASSQARLQRKIPQRGVGLLPQIPHASFAGLLPHPLHCWVHHLPPALPEDAPPPAMRQSRSWSRSHSPRGVPAPLGPLPESSAAAGTPARAAVQRLGPRAWRPRAHFGCNCKKDDVKLKYQGVGAEAGAPTQCVCSGRCGIFALSISPWPTLQTRRRAL